MEISKLIEFIKEADKLKNVERKTYTYHAKRHENSGEHSWHLALAVLVFASESNEKVDILKCLKMAVLHDIVEIEAGDQIVYSEDKNKYERELEAAKKLFSILPKELGEEFLNLWIEFERKETPEAQFVGALDRFLPLYSNVLNEGLTWEKYQIKAHQVFELNEPAISKGSQKLWEKANIYLQKSIQDGLLK